MPRTRTKPQRLQSAENGIIDERLIDPGRMQQAYDAFVGRQTRSQSKDQKGYDKAPEVQLPSVPPRVLLVGRLGRPAHAVKQQELI